MKKLSHILHSKYFFLILLLLTLCYLIIAHYFVTSKYNGTENIFYGTILALKENSGQVTLEVKAKEKLLVYYKGEEQFHIGDKVRITGRLEKPSQNRNFHLFNYQEYLKGKQIYWIVKDTEIVLVKKAEYFYSLKNKIIKRMQQSPNQNYLYAFLLGDSSKLAYKSTYQELGISHLFAVSGMHILFIAGMLMKVLKRIIHHEMASFLITGIILTFYVWLLSDSMSANRAYFLYILSFLNQYYKWSFKSLELLLFVFAISVFRNPFCILQTGFQFSFIICFFLMFVKQEEKHGYMKSLFKTSLLAFLVSFPLSIYHFHQIHLGTIFFNMVAVPFVSIILFPLSFLSFFFPAFEVIFSFLLMIFHHIIDFFSLFHFLKIPFCAFPKIILFLYYGILIWWFTGFKHGKYVFFILAFLHFLFPYMNPYYSIDMIDIGQGDAILIRYPHLKGTILVDCGGTLNASAQTEQVLIPYLKALGIHKIDALILTHGDYDHMGNALTLTQKITIGSIFMNQGNDNELEQTFLSQVGNIPIFKIDQKTVKIKGQTFQFLNSNNHNDENEDSLIFFTQLGNKNILFMGDAGKKTEKKILEEYNLPKMDILKVGHHGSKNSTDELFLQIIQPEYALISAGVHNFYSHPHQETIKALEKVHSKVIATNQVGSIRLILKSKIEVKTCF